MNNVTIETVSERAGVSKTTVSRYLNACYEHMSEKTRLRIKDTIEELGYRPNLLARNLKTKKTGLIGLIISDISNPITATLVKGITDYCVTEGYQVVTSSSDEKSKKEEEYILSMVDMQIDGFIIGLADYNDYAVLHDLKRRGVHIVLADRTISEDIFDTVTSNNYDISHNAIEKLYELGYERVALFSSELLKSRVRLSRYRAFLDSSAKHVERPMELCHIVENESACIRALRDFMDEHKGFKKAIFASTPMALLNMLAAARELSIDIPKDLGLLGYDNLNWTRLISGGISVIDQPFYQVGLESARLLIQRMRGEYDGPPKYIELPSRLILRNSTKVEILKGDKDV